MARTTILASATAVLAAAAVGAGVIGSPVGSAGAAAPFSITKSQYNQVKTNASKALRKSSDNATAIKRLKAATVAGVQGPKGDPGPAGGFDPAKLARVVGPLVPVASDLDHVSYSLDCPPGTVVLSGGQYMSPGNEKGFRSVNSYPQSDLSGWTFRWAYSVAAGNSVNVTPYVLCVASS